MANNTLLQQDTFASGSLAAGWSAYSGLSVSQVVNVPPHVTEPNALSTTAGQVWTGNAFPNDQICEVTSRTLTSEPSTVLSLLVRWTNQASPNGYQVNITNGTVLLYRVDAGAGTQLGSTVSSLTFAANDVWTFQAAGASLNIYQNFKRILYYYDATYTSGIMGYLQIVSGSATVAHNQVASWRGYSVAQQDGIWAKQSIVIPALAGDLSISPTGQGLQCVTIMREGNAQILSGVVFKAWPLNPAGGNTYYMESVDGVTWTRNGSPTLTSFLNTTVFKNGSTYYAYCQASGSGSTGNMAVFTGSDGVTWAQQTPSQIIGLGAGGTWDSVGIYPIEVIAVVGGTWYALYIGTNDGVNLLYSTGLATSTDGINWVKSGSNPVIANVLSAGTYAKVGSTYYMWGQANQPGQGNAHGPLLDPIECVRYKTTDPTFVTWTLSSHSAHNTQMFESLNSNAGYVYPAGMIDYNGKSYFFINVGPSDALPVVGQIELAIAPGTVANITTVNEDGTTLTATDPFTSGAGDLSANWTTATGFTKLKIIAGNLVEPTVLATSCVMYYSGASFGAGQYTEVTLHNLVSGSFVYPWLYIQPASGTLNGYALQLSGNLNTLNTGAFAIQKYITGTGTQIGPLGSITFHVGDVFRLSVNPLADGTNLLTAYQNGFQMLQVQDYAASFTSGSPGMLMYAATSLANSQISNWNGGATNVTPTFPGTGSNAGAMRLRRRKRIYAIP